jgi:hypothetical protein
MPRGSSRTLTYGLFIGPRRERPRAPVGLYPIRLRCPAGEAFEVSMAGNDAWAQRVQGAPARAQAAGLKDIIDVRMTLAGACSGRVRAIRARGG